MDGFINRHVVGWRNFPPNWLEGKLFFFENKVISCKDPAFSSLFSFHSWILFTLFLFLFFVFFLKGVRGWERESEME